MQLHFQICRNFIEITNNIQQTTYSRLSTHLILMINFLQRLQFPLHLTNDSYLNIVITLISPFQINPLIQSQTLPIILIFALNSLVLLIILFRPTFKNLLITHYITLLYHLLYLPQLITLLHYLNNQPITTFTILPIIAILILLLILSLQIYLFRLTHFIPQNPFQIKYSHLTPISILVDIVLMQLISQKSQNSFTLYITLIFVNLSPLITLLKLTIIQPYLPIICSIKGFYAAVQLSITLLITILQQTQTIFYFLLFITPPLTLLIRRISALIHTQNQYTLIYQMQKLYSQQSTIPWFLWVDRHQKKCKSDHCQKMIIQQINDRHAPLTRALILCEFQRQLALPYDQELLQLITVDFQKAYCHSQIPAYCALKEYEAKSVDQNSWFFKVSREQINEEVITEIRKGQKSIQIQFGASNMMKIGEIHAAHRLQEKYIQKTVVIVNEKLKFWKQMITGYHSIKVYYEQILELSRLIHLFKMEMNQDINLSKQSDYIIVLKITSIYYSIVLNDFRNSQVAEIQIDDLLKANLNSVNQVVMNDNLILLKASLVRNRGLILNKDRQQLATFFNYDDPMKFSHIKHINQLMPEFISRIHNSLLDSFIRSGKSELFHSERYIYFLRMDGFVEMASLRVDNFFEQLDDYVLTAQLNKTKQNAQIILFSGSGQIFCMTKEFNKVFDFSQGQSILFYFPQLATFICQQKETLMRGDEVEDKEVLQQTVYNRQFDQLMDEQSIKKQRMSVSQNTFKKFESNFSNKTIKNETHLNEEGVLLFDANFVEYINNILNSEDLFQLRNRGDLYMVKFTLTMRVVGSGHKKISFFTLELSDYKRRDMATLSMTTNYNNFNIVQTQFITINQEPSQPSLDAEISEIQPESLEQIQSSMGLQKVSSLTKSRKNLQIEIDCEEIDHMVSMSSRFYAPLSQRAQFRNVASGKQLEMEDELKQVEEDFKQLYEIQQSSRLQLSAREQMESYRVSQTQRLNQLGDIFEEQEEEQEQDQKQRSSSQNQKKVQESALKRIQQFKQEIEGVGSVSSSAKTTSSNASMALVRRIQQTRALSPSLQRIALINGILMTAFMMFIIVNVSIAEKNHWQAERNARNLIAPYEYNRFYCKTFALSWSKLQEELGIVEYSGYIESRIDDELSELNGFLLEVLYELESVFMEVESMGLWSSLNMDLIRESRELNVTFARFDQVLKDKIQRVISTNGQQLDEEYVYDILFIKVNLRNTIDESTFLIGALVEIYLRELENDRIEVLTYLLVQVGLFISIVMSQLYYWRRVLNYKQRILFLLARLYESDVNKVMNKLNLIKDILTKSSDINWKRANYFQLMFVSSHDIIQESIHHHSNSQSNSNQQHRQVMLSQRIPNRLPLLPFTVMTLLTAAVMTLNSLGGYLIYSAQEQSLFPSQQLTAMFTQFSLQFDALVATSMILKTEYLVIPHIIERNLLTINQDQSLSYFSSPDNIISSFHSLAQTYSKDTVNILSNIEYNNKLDTNTKNHFYQLYSQDLCQPLFNNLTFCNSLPSNARPSDNNKEYFRNGIIGLYSQFQQYLKENFETELDSQQYDQNNSRLLSTINSNQYIQGTIQHFLDSQLAFETFNQIIIQITQQQLDQNQINIKIYYITLGTLLQLLFMCFFYLLITYQNHTLLLLRLAIVNIPYQSLLDPQVISLLKKLDRD